LNGCSSSVNIAEYNITLKLKEGDIFMQFLLIHWHCILPVLGILAAIFFMRDKPREKKTNNDTNIIP
jgi:prolipoprotein diacylglyceryltransferase